MKPKSRASRVSLRSDYIPFRHSFCMDPVIKGIRRELDEQKDELTQKVFQRFFKEEVKYYGVKTATVAKIAKKYWKDIKSRDKNEIFGLCEELYKSGYCEEAFIVSNWAECDGFCNHTVGDFIEKYPDSIAELKSWAGSNNRWLRRAAAVSLIIPAKHGKYLDDVIEIADILLTDQDDMVQKGYGWLLKEASRNYQAEVLDYVMRNRKVMPRTSLRYAIELMPKATRLEAMMRDW